MRTEPKKTKAPDQSLVTWRENMGFSQADAATALGCSRTALGGWERDPQTTPRYIILATMALSMGLEAEGGCSEAA